MLRELVQRLLVEKVGGVEYFDALDEALRGPEYFALLFDFWLRKHRLGSRMVVTGKFGEEFAWWFNENYPGSHQPLVLPGGLRKGPIFETPELPEAAGHTYDLLDDSFYKGRTALEVSRVLTENEARLNGTYVLYDGSLEKRPFVHSLYRYHNTEED